MTSIVTDVLFVITVAVLVQDVFSKVLYHYTDEKGSQQIFGSGYLKSSTTGAFGAGVYLTSYSPKSKSRTVVAKNNWAIASPTALSKTKCVYEVVVSGAIQQKSHRDIYLYTGGDIVFKETNDWNLYDWTSTSAKVVRGKYTKQCFTKSACVQNLRRKRSVYVSFGTAGFPNMAKCSGQTTTGSMLATITSSIVVCLLIFYIST